MEPRPELELYSFCKLLPKIELHAHLNGSLSQRTLLELQRLRADECEDTTDAFLGEFRIESGDARSYQQDVFGVFAIAHTLTNTPAAVKLATRLTIEEFQQDGCSYIELRSTPRSTEHMTARQYVDAIVDAVRTTEADIIAKLIISIDRRWTFEQASRVTDLAVECFGAYPDVVVGLELSGDPEYGRFSVFVPLFDRARAAGMKISLHCGETSPAEVSEMIAFGADRLGHAVCVLPRTGGAPELWSQLLVSKIPVEICISSNVKCKSVNSYEEHHFRELYQAGHPVAISTDDAGVFATSLSHEYTIASRTFSLSRSHLAELALDTVEYAFSDGAKDELRRRVKAFIADWKL